MQTQTEKETQEIKVEIIGDSTIQLDVKDALRFPLIPPLMRDMINEFYTWYTQHYSYPVYVRVQRGSIGIAIEYDIMRDVDACIDLCFKRAQEDKLNPHDVGPSCAEGCLNDFRKNADFTFRTILTKLKEIIDKRGYSYKVYDYWDFTTRKLVIVVKL
jgi:hypothetical protein